MLSCVSQQEEGTFTIVPIRKRLSSGQVTPARCAWVQFSVIDWPGLSSGEYIYSLLGFGPVKTSTVIMTGIIHVGDENKLNRDVLIKSILLFIF